MKILRYSLILVLIINGNNIFGQVKPVIEKLSREDFLTNFDSLLTGLENVNINTNADRSYIAYQVSSASFISSEITSRKGIISYDSDQLLDKSSGLQSDWQSLSKNLESSAIRKNERIILKNSFELKGFYAQSVFFNNKKHYPSNDHFLILIIEENKLEFGMMVYGKYDVLYDKIDLKQKDENGLKDLKNWISTYFLP